MTLALQGPMAQPHVEEPKKDDRIRVRLHFGGTFAQDAPHQWRYVGGEVFNESFPLEAKYADVCLRLNDKFGDTVSFKYLCPGDDLDPDELVQVQGDDDLTEMKDEYTNAVTDARAPVKTVRLKIYVFRAIIFELCGGQDAELDDEQMVMPDDCAQPGSMDASGDPEECGPDFSEWEGPDEATVSSVPSAQPSSDADLRSGAAVAAAAAATAALHNISRGVTSGASGRASARGVPSVSAALAAGITGGFSSRRSSAGWQAQMLAQQRTHSGTEGSGDAVTGSGGGSGSACRLGRGGVEAGVGSAVAAAGGAVEEAQVDNGYSEVLAASLYPARDALYEQDEEGDYQAGGEPYEEPYEEGYGEEYGEEGLRCDEEGGEGEYVAPTAALFAEQPQHVVEELAGGRQRSGGEEVLPAARNWQVREQEDERQRLLMQQQKEIVQQHDQLQHRHEHERQLQAQKHMEEHRQRQEQQRLEQERARHEQEQIAQRQRGVENSGIGFYCDEELDNPYGEQDDDTAAAGAGLFGMRIGNVPNGHCGGSASDDALHMAPRAADMAAYGDDLDGMNGGAGEYVAGAGGNGRGRASNGGGVGTGPGGLGRGLFGRLAAADMLPRHISAFGESSRDDSEAGAGGGAHGSGPFLPSRITIFGDDESPAGTPTGGPDSGALGRITGGSGTNTGGLHRLAVLGGTASAHWPDPAAGGRMVDPVGFLGAPDRLVGDSGLCITQEFGTQQKSSLLELGDYGENGSGGGADGGGGGRGGRKSPLDPLMLPMGLGGPVGLGLVLLDEHLGSGGGAAANHPLKGVVKKRKHEVSIMAKIGEGAFGEVSQAQVFPYGIVAIKWLKRERFAKYSESFQREAETLAKLNHPNIIRMYGLVMDTPASDFGAGGGSGGGGGGGSGGHGGGPGGSGGTTVGNTGSGAGTPTGLIGGIITEFVRNGSLGQYLRSQGGRKLSLRQRAMIALQASLGMAYLHEQSPAVVHFDLKPDNLLVDGEGDSMVIKVADFGLSKHKLSSHVSCRDLRGTLPYMAYELVSNAGNISEKVDVYSMGVVMWEMYTGEVPFAHLTAQEILMGLLHGNLHLAIPPACEPEWRSLVETCMDPNPANRPSFQELAMQLEEILRLERQASNASSISAAAVAAAAAAVLNSSTNTQHQQHQQATQGDAGYSSGGGGHAAGRATAPGIHAPQAAAGLGLGGAALAAGAAAAPVGLPQWRMPAPIMPPIAPVGPSQPSPIAPPAQGLLGRQLLLPPHAPQPQAPSPLLAQLAAGQHQQQQHTSVLHHFGLGQSLSPSLFAAAASDAWPTVPSQLPPSGQQQQHQPQLRPSQPHPMPPQPQHLQYAQQHFSPAPALVLPQAALAQHAPFGMPLQPQHLFPPQQHIVQHGMNGLYGLGGGAAGAGMPPLVSWGERGRG